MVNLYFPKGKIFGCKLKLSAGLIAVRDILLLACVHPDLTNPTFAGHSSSNRSSEVSKSGNCWRHKDAVGSVHMPSSLAHQESFTRRVLYMAQNNAQFITILPQSLIRITEFNCTRSRTF